MSGAGVDGIVQHTGPGATLDAWRERGAHRFDPVRFRFIEALARRAADHGGEARRILDEKLARLIAAYGEDLERARCADGDTDDGSASSSRDREPRPSSLAQLVDHIARHAVAQGEGRAAGAVVHGAAHPPELKTLRYFRSTWSRLAADQRLTQSLAKVPENAGPLNSHHLVQRALTSMRDLSPEYLDRFMSYVDALLWLDQAAHGGGASEAKDVPRAGADRKAARGRAANG